MAPIGMHTAMSYLADVSQHRISTISTILSIL